MARTRSAPPRQSWRQFVPGLILVAGLGLFLLAVIEVGEFTRSRISGWDRYALDFGEIECSTPPVLKRAELLAEVQALAALPSRLQLLDQDLPSSLGEAFSRHPYVEKVEQVVISSRKVEIRLRYRRPVLEVMLSEREHHVLPATSGSKETSRSDLADDPSWFVDCKGILLPRKKLSDPLPLLLVTTPPKGKAGQPWGEPSIEAAARTAAFLEENQTRFKLKVFETQGAELVLSTPGGTRVLWGHAPDQEPAGEARAGVTLDRLLGFCTKHGVLEKPRERYEHDLRPLREATHRPLGTD